MPDAVLEEIFAELEAEENRPTCARCGRPMVSNRAWSAADEDERWEMWLDGYEACGRAVGISDQCNPCAFKRGPLEEDELARRDARRFRHLRYRDLLAEGLTDQAEIAQRLGITKDGLRRNIINWKERGLL